MGTKQYRAFFKWTNVGSAKMFIGTLLSAYFQLSRLYSCCERACGRVAKKHSACRECLCVSGKAKLTSRITRAWQQANCLFDHFKRTLQLSKLSLETLFGNKNAVLSLFSKLSVFLGSIQDIRFRRKNRLRC